VSKPYVVYGQKGTGSVPVEATLLLLGEPYELLQPAQSENPQAGDLNADEMARINPMQQLPAVVLPNGELMTESAAILIHLADSHPAARLAPAPDDPKRPAFWRIMDAQVSPGRYILGDDLSVLDLYVTVVSHWGPRRPRFEQEAPKMAEVVRRVDRDPRLEKFWAERLH
jgi:GST-like protein